MAADCSECGHLLDDHGDGVTGTCTAWLDDDTMCGCTAFDTEDEDD